MKKLLLSIIFFCVYSLTYAVYVENYPIELKQPDGTTVSCYISGDEYYQRVHDADGYTLIRDSETGYIVYAELENDNLIPSKIVFSNDPNFQTKKSSLLKKHVDISAKKKEQIRADFIKNTPSKPVLIPKAPKSAKNQGILNNLVIFISFADDNGVFISSVPEYESIFNNQSSSSMYKYFWELSYQTLQIPSTFYPTPSGNEVISYKDDKPRSYYEVKDANNSNGYNGDSDRTVREHTLLKKAIQYVEKEIPSNLNIDFDDDGYVDNICFIVKGDNGAWNSLLWPHQWALYTEIVTLNEKRVWTYNFQLENHMINASNGKESVLAHEMFHALGAPDLYRYQSGGIDPVGTWDLMCSNTVPPQSTNAYMKYKYGGWITDIPEITSSGTYTINNIWSSTNNCFKLASPSSNGEYFMIEYRNKVVSWEQNVPGSGLIIYRINPTLNGNSNGPPDEVYVFRPNGTTTENGSLYQAFFSSEAGRTSFSDTTNPKAFLSNGSDGLDGIEIKNISSTGTNMTFDVVFPPPVAPVALAADNVKRTSFLAKWEKAKASTEYKLSLYYKNQGENVYTMNNSSVGKETSFEVTGLDRDLSTTWYYSIRSVSGGIESNLSNEIQVDLVMYDPIICDYITNIDENDSKAGWLIHEDPITGYNSNSHEYAEYFSLPDIAQISGVKMDVQTANADITVKIWDMGIGGPGNVLYTEDFPVSQLNTGINELTFASPIVVPADFYIGYEIKTSNPQTQFAIHCTSNKANNTLYFKFAAANTWHSFSIYGHNFAAFIYPNLCNFIPESEFDSNNIETCIDESVQFNNTTIATAETKWLWDFGDGNTSSEKNPSHKYENSGKYTVSLTAESYTGINEITKTNYITVNELPTVNYSVTNTSSSESNDGIIELTITGSGNYLIAWTDDTENNYSDQSKRENLAPGTYSVEVMDAETTCIRLVENIVVGINSGTSTETIEYYDFDLFPNPADDFITITTDKALIVKIYSIDGTLCLLKDINTTNNINIKDLKQGIYIVNICDENNNESNQKLIVK